MYKLFSLAALGLTSAGLTLATPAASQAQTPLGIRVNVGNVGFSYAQGYPSYVAPTYVPPVPVATYYTQPTLVPVYGGYAVQPSVIVQPSYSVGGAWCPPHHHRHHAPYVSPYYRR